MESGLVTRIQHQEVQTSLMFETEYKLTDTDNNSHTLDHQMTQRVTYM